MMEKDIKSLSSRQMRIVAWLEFYQKYFFTIKDIEHFFENKEQRYNSIKRMMGKKRIIKLSKNRYYLVPVKARTDRWSEDPFIIADEIFDGKDYFIGGLVAANYWDLTDQIPFRIEVFTTKRQGRRKIINTEFIFKRTTSEKIKRAVIRKVNNHPFRIMNKREMKKWMKSRERFK